MSDKMKFVVEGAEWYKKLTFVMPAVPPANKAEKTWSEGIYIEASADTGLVTVTTTDLRQIGMKVSLKATVESSGKALIHSNVYALFDLLQKDGDITIDYDKESKIVSIANQYYRGKFPCLDVDDFRVLGLDEDDSHAKKFDMPVEVLRIIVETVAPSADPKDIESGKSGVLLRCEQKLDQPILGATVQEVVGGRKVPVTYAGIDAGPSRLIAVAVDGKKLSKYEVTGLFDAADGSYFATIDGDERPFAKVPHFEMMVPAGLLQTSHRALTGVVGDNDKLAVSVFGGFVTFRCGTAAIALRLLSSPLPNWRRILSGNPTFSLVVGTNELKLAAQVASVSNMAKRDDPIILYLKDGAFSIGNSIMNVDDRSARKISGLKEIKGTAPTEEYTHCFRSDYFHAIMNYIKTDFVQLDFAGSHRPLVCYPCVVAAGSDKDKPRYEADKHFIASVMPVRMNG